jgi:hypothetical protein
MYVHRNYVILPLVTIFLRPVPTLLPELWIAIGESATSVHDPSPYPALSIKWNNALQGPQSPSYADLECTGLVVKNAEVMNCCILDPDTELLRVINCSIVGFSAAGACGKPFRGPSGTTSLGPVTGPVTGGLLHSRLLRVVLITRAYTSKVCRKLDCGEPASLYTNKSRRLTTN